jgi:hypothetical protein
VPFLFAATLFLSASLLFMIQPMVGKMVLPLLGGSPAVWNACMVFFQMLLLLGYQYAHHITGRYSPRKQWAIHLLVLGLPIAAFFLAITFGARHSPIAIAESLAPGGDESSPVLSVLAMLTIAIGVPFFVISTSAPLLQRWFTATGHPSARDPYFLYSASNAGSLISLLGYPFFIEPNMTIDQQAWMFAIGFAVLTVLVFFCGQAAANPIGVPPSVASSGTKGNTRSPAIDKTSPAATQVVVEPPPSLLRMLKWVALAFVPSSLMLGVTFHMTTDIASIPLLWVIPLALYLITFIIAFGRVPDWFRLVIGNAAPVMLLLLIFVMISDVNPGYFIKMVLHILTFFAVALMCHYELARDRPSPEYLTKFFLLMSVGGVLGGIFNSLVAPLVFPYAYEYPLVLIISCLMVPRLLSEGSEEGLLTPTSTSQTTVERVRAWAEEWVSVIGVIANAYLLTGILLWLFHYEPRELSLGAGVTIPEFSPKPVFQLLLGALGGGFLWVACLELYARYSGQQPWLARRIWKQLPLPVRIALLILFNPLVLPWVALVVVNSRRRLQGYLDFMIPLIVGLGFYALVRLSYQSWYIDRQKNIAQSLNLSQDTVRAVLIFAVPVMVCFFFVDRPVRFALCVAAILGYHMYREIGSGVIHSERSFFGILKIEEDTDYQRPIFRNSEGDLTWSGRIEYHRLVHGTTLHGTQIHRMDNNVFDTLQFLTAIHPWDNIAVAGANHAFNPREEPLTYYHRTGPVGAMFSELRTRKGGADAKADVAMVGLGTGSASCYVLPGQRLTFYEIDPAVKHLVADTDKFFTYVTDGKKRAQSQPGGDVDIRMGDARLKLKDDADRRYALLLVDAFSSDSIPVHLLTKEAVQLYLDRMTEDGLLGLHISNRWVRLEPVVAAIARDLGLTARVWNDDKEGRPGKTASSWVVLARKPEYLGKLYAPLGDIVFNGPSDSGDDRAKLSMDAVLSEGLQVHYDQLSEIQPGSRRPLYQVLNQDDSPRAAWLDWAMNKYADLIDPSKSLRFQMLKEALAKNGVFSDLNEPYWDWINAKLKEPADTPEKARLAKYIELIRDYGPNATHQDVMIREHGHAFRRLETLSQVPAWTDDYSDVMRVMNFPELQRVREFFGLPTPVKR